MGCQWICIGSDVYVRHAKDESVVWCPRTGGCTVLRNAQPILDEVKREWRDVEAIVCAVAVKSDCGVEDVRVGVEAVVGELISQRFVEVVDVVAMGGTPVGSVNGEDARSHVEDDNWTPLGDFYARHRLPCELHIDLTDGCNEKCVHCYLPHGGSHYIDKDITLKVLKEFREVQGLTVFISGG